MKPKETKHTPGPWHVASVIFHKPIPAHESLAVWDETHGQKDDSITGRPVAILTPLETLNPMDEANARLIAASPDLLEACRRVAEWMDKAGGPHNTHDPYGVLAAIAKAEKGSQ